MHEQWDAIDPPFIHRQLPCETRSSADANDTSGTPRILTMVAASITNFCLLSLISPFKDDQMNQFEILGACVMSEMESFFIWLNVVSRLML